MGLDQSDLEADDLVRHVGPENNVITERLLGATAIKTSKLHKNELNCNKFFNNYEPAHFKIPCAKTLIYPY